jgi:hypothetical protein
MAFKMFTYVSMYASVFCAKFSHGDISHTLKDFSVPKKQHYSQQHFFILAKQVPAGNHKNHG